MHAANRMLGLTAIMTVCGSCGWVEAQAIVNKGAKPSPTPPGVARQPQLNVGSGNGGGKALANKKRLSLSQETPDRAKPHVKEEEQRHGQHHKKHKDESEEALLEHVKLKHEGHRRHMELVGGTRVVGEELVGGSRVVGDEEVVVVGRKYFAPDSVWVGTRENGNNQWAVRLSVNKFDGNSFKGVLSQRSVSGELERQKVEGEVDGDTIAFSTCGVLEGTRQPLSFDGSFSDDEMRIEVSGRGRKGEDLGTMILVRE